MRLRMNVGSAWPEPEPLAKFGKQQPLPIQRGRRHDLHIPFKKRSAATAMFLAIPVHLKPHNENFRGCLTLEEGNPAKVERSPWLGASSGYIQERTHRLCSIAQIRSAIWWLHYLFNSRSGLVQPPYCKQIDPTNCLIGLGRKEKDRAHANYGTLSFLLLRNEKGADTKVQATVQTRVKSP